jgi:hypothetical protein
MALFALLGVLRGFPPSCPACIWRGDVLKYASPQTAGQAGENPCAALLIDPDFIIWPSFLNWKLINVFVDVRVIICYSHSDSDIVLNPGCKRKRSPNQRNGTRG